MRRDGESKKHYIARMERFSEEMNTPKEYDGTSNGMPSFPPGVRLIGPDDITWN